MDLARERGAYREFYGLVLYAGAIVAVGVALAFLVTWWDRRYDLSWLAGLELTLQGSRQALTAFGTTILSVLGIVLAVSVAIIAMMTGSYGPRIVQVFILDRLTLAILAVFLVSGTYALSLFLLIGRAEMPPHMAAVTTSLLAFACVAAFFLFIMQALRSLQAVTIINRVGDALDAEIDRLYPVDVEEQPGADTLPEGGEPLLASSTGYIRRIQVRRLTSCLAESQATLALGVLPGDFVLRGATVGYLRRNGLPIEDRKLRKYLRIGRRRSLYQDVRFGFLQLVEIGGRALSPAVNEPFTGIQCIHRMVQALDILSSRPRGENLVCDESGRARLSYPELGPTWLLLPLDVMRQMGANVPIVLRELGTAVELLATRMHDERERRELDGLAARLERTIARLPEEDQWIVRDRSGVSPIPRDFRPGRGEIEGDEEARPPEASAPLDTPPPPP